MLRCWSMNHLFSRGFSAKWASVLALGAVGAWPARKCTFVCQAGENFVLALQPPPYTCLGSRSSPGRINPEVAGPGRVQAAHVAAHKAATSNAKTQPALGAFILNTEEGAAPIWGSQQLS